MTDGEVLVREQPSSRLSWPIWSPKLPLIWSLSFPPGRGRRQTGSDEPAPNCWRLSGPHPFPDDAKVARPRLKPIHRRRELARRRFGRPALARHAGPGRGASGSAVAAGVSRTGAGVRPTGGSLPKRARQLPHKTIGSRLAGRASSNRRHPRPERQTAQRRPSLSISIKSSVCNGVLPLAIERRRAVALKVGV